MAAAKFFESKLADIEKESNEKSDIRYNRIAVTKSNKDSQIEENSYVGAALGPHWIANYALNNLNNTKVILKLSFFLYIFI